MSNTWTINDEIVKDFENFAPLFSATQPPFAEKSCLSLTEISPWTNRVPQHEPWPRLLKQDKGDTQNEQNTGYKNNVDWVDQFDNKTPEGLKPIGKVEGDETIERGKLWRR